MRGGCDKKRWQIRADFGAGGRGRAALKNVGRAKLRRRGKTAAFFEGVRFLPRDFLCVVNFCFSPTSMKHFLFEGFGWEAKGKHNFLYRQN